MTNLGFDAVTALLWTPLVAALILALLPGQRLKAHANVAASFLTFLFALTLLVTKRPPPGTFILIDDLNIVFIVLGSFVGFTTSVFSASYIAHEIMTGRLPPAYLRFYHAMYQILMFAMNLALVSNNIGLMWVAVEMATLTTVVMVGIYRTHEALEAAWKYFILGSVGIALAFFGTILVYVAAEPVIGEGLQSMAWTVLSARVAALDPALLTSRSCSCSWAMAPRWVWRRSMPGCPTPMPRARRRSRPCCRDFCSTSRSTPFCASRSCSRGTAAPSRPARSW